MVAATCWWCWLWWWWWCVVHLIITFFRFNLSLCVFLFCFVLWMCAARCEILIFKYFFCLTIFEICTVLDLVSCLLLVSSFDLKIVLSPSEFIHIQNELYYCYSLETDSGRNASFYSVPYASIVYILISALSLCSLFSLAWPISEFIAKSITM